MTAKCVKKYVIKNKLTHDDFMKVIQNKTQLRHNMNTMRSVKHQLGKCECRKVTQSCFDDKRHLTDDGITSYAYGRCNIDGKYEVESDWNSDYTSNGDSQDETGLGQIGQTMMYSNRVTKAMERQGLVLHS